MVLVAIAAACGDATGASRHISIHNGLHEFVDIHTDSGTGITTLVPGVHQRIAVSRSARNLIWSADNPVRARSELTGDTVAITDTTATIEITSMRRGARYFLLRFENTTGKSLFIGVGQGGLTNCLGVEETTSPGHSTDWGYWPLDSGYSVRYFPSGTCGGAFLQFSPTDVASHFDPATSIVSLSVSSLP